MVKYICSTCPCVNCCIILMQFTARGQRFFLTWPQSGALTFRIIENHLRGIGPVEWMITGLEHHEDGNEHYHTVVKYQREIRKQNNPFTIDEFVCNVKKIGRKKSDLARVIRYVKKENNYREYGMVPNLEEIVDRRDKLYYLLQHDNKHCIDSGLFSISEICKLNNVRNMWYYDWPQFKKRCVWWFYGETGSGKTRKAFEILQEKYDLSDIWISSGRIDPFFNGYTHQHAAILDDFRSTFAKFEFLLRLFDGYPVTVNVKGSYACWNAETIIVTAPIHPMVMFTNRESGEPWDNIDQLLRRLDKIIEFPMNNDTEIIWFDDPTSEELI